MHVATTMRVYRGKVYHTHLLRRSVRVGKKVKHETLGNLSHLPPDVIELIRRRLRGEVPMAADTLQICRNLAHGHVAAVLGCIEQIGLDQMLASRPCRERTLVLAMLVSRLLTPQSKLATARTLTEEAGTGDTATTSLAVQLDLGQVSEDDLYTALDWLEARQQRIENKLAKRQLHDGTLVLYDVSSSYYTGKQSSLVRFGYNRDGKKECPQIVYGLLCNANGCPVSIEVFAGNTADPKTLGPQIEKLRRRFRVRCVVLVGDRGLITSRQIDEHLRGVEGLDWITALRADSIRKLVHQGVLQMSLFDETNLAEIQSPDYPGERLIVCRNPLLADERTRKRAELLAATEKDLEAIAAATTRPRRPLRGKGQIGLRVGRVLGKHKVGKHFQITIEETRFTYQRRADQIAAEAALDGLYIVRTSVTPQTLSADATVRAYKDLSKVERAFRCLKTVDLRVRPIFHWREERIKAHVFLCMLSYYVEWHLRQKWAPLLFDDHDKQAAAAQRPDAVAPAERSAAAQQKDLTKRTAAGEPVHSFRGLLQYLGTLCKNRVRLQNDPEKEFYLLTQPTPLQQRAFELLGVPLTL